MTSKLRGTLNGWTVRGLRRTTGFVVVVCVAGLGCNDAERPSSIGSVEWSLDTNPKVVLSPVDMEGDSNASGGVLTSRHQVILGGAESSRVFLFDSVGTRLRAVDYPAIDSTGRRHLRWLGRCQPSNAILAQDLLQREFVFFNEELDIKRTAAYPRAYTYARPLQCTSGGSVVAMKREPIANLRSGGNVDAPGELLKFSAARTGSDSLGVVDSLAKLPPTEFFFALPSGYVEQPFGKATLAASNRNGIWVSSVDRDEVAVFDSSGRTIRRISLGIKPHTTNSSDLAVAIASRVWDEPFPSTRQLLTRVLAAAPTRSAKLALDRMLVGSDGNTWVRSFEVDSIGRRRWFVFDSSGNQIAFAHIPVSLRLMDAGWGEILAFRHVGSSEQSGGTTVVLSLETRQTSTRR